MRHREALPRSFRSQCPSRREPLGIATSMNRFPLPIPIAAACVLACSLVAQAQTPGTDGFAARPPLVLGSGEIATGFASNESASAEFGEPDHMAQPSERSIWWSWTAATGGVVEIDTIDSTFLTRLVVYTGSSLSLLEPVAGNVTDIATPNIESVVRFVAVPGTTYSIVVDGYNEFIAETGQIFLTLAHPAPGTPPANDNFSGAESLGNAASAAISGDTSAASVEALEPDPETTFFPSRARAVGLVSLDGAEHRVLHSASGRRRGPVGTGVGNLPGIGTWRAHAGRQRRGTVIRAGFVEHGIDHGHVRCGGRPDLPHHGGRPIVRGDPRCLRPRAQAGLATRER